MQLASSDVLVADPDATWISLQQTPTPVDSKRTKEADDAPMPDVGAILLQRWRLQAWAGLGSASIVFRGEHVELPLPVAIKIVNRQHYAERRDVVAHLRNEAHILARLRHTNLVRLWDFQEEGEYPCLVTDFIDGVTLRQMIRQHGRLDPRRAVRAALQIADVLAAVWREGVVHRDVKPENVLLSVDGTAKLIDFGLATTPGTENAPAHSGRSPNARVGTVAYLAPEQARNSAAVDYRADVYSLGAALYHAATGRLPFAGNNAAQMVLRHIEDVPVPPMTIVPEMNPLLSDVILRMMAKEPKERCANAREVVEALQYVQTEMSAV
jgi:serine/threonine protein kinase